MVTKSHEPSNHERILLAQIDPHSPTNLTRVSNGKQVALQHKPLRSNIYHTVTLWGGTMAKSNAERQRAYRKRHAETADRINFVIDPTAKISLDRLASCYTVTQRAMLERIISGAEQRLLSELSGSEQNEYYDKLLKLD